MSYMCQVAAQLPQAVFEGIAFCTDSSFFVSVQEPDQRLHKPALESLRTQIRASTTSMTSVPKPLKFLRPHYETIKAAHEKIVDKETKVNSTGLSSRVMAEYCY